MKRFKQERLKDILIDHVFDYCYNEIVQKIEGDNIKISYDNPNQLNDPATNVLVEQALKSGNVKSYYSPRETEYCSILVDKDIVYKGLTDKLLNLGFKKGDKLFHRIEEAQKYLISRSYFAQSKPIENQVKLTEKGLRHYLDGKSFEIEYILRRNSNIAIWISVTSLIIALSALFIKSNAA